MINFTLFVIHTRQIIQIEPRVPERCWRGIDCEESPLYHGFHKGHRGDMISYAISASLGKKGSSIADSFNKA